MDCLLKNARIIDPRSDYHQQRGHVLVSEGLIKEINTNTIPDHDPSAKVIDLEDLHISPVWTDIYNHFCDPGMEHREDLFSGSEAAFFGGFGRVGVLPETTPPLQSKESITYIRNRNNGHIVELLPFGAISKDLKGEELTEMYDLYQAGAYAFTEGDKPLIHSELLLNGMQYSHSFGAGFMITPRDPFLERNGVVHEGKIHLSLGAQALPPLAEEVSIRRELSISEYIGAPVHFTKISHARSVELIEDAQKKGLPVTAGVSINNLCFSEEDLMDFNTNLKLTPPLRGKEDQEQLKEGIKKRVITSIVSDHRPVEDELKNCEFESAEFGAIGLQTLFPAALEALDGDLETLVELISINPGKLINSPAPILKENSAASLTLFQPNAKWTFDKTNNRSLSFNSPFWNRELKGRAAGIIKGETVRLT